MELRLDVVWHIGDVVQAQVRKESLKIGDVTLKFFLIFIMILHLRSYVIGVRRVRIVRQTRF